MPDLEVSLVNYSDFSYENNELSKLVSALAERGYKAAALTDRGNMCGAIQFYKKAKAAGIKPIIGADVRIAHERGEGRIVLLARDERGYKNLIKVISRANMEADADEEDPLVKMGWLAELSGGLVALSGGPESAEWAALNSDGGEALARDLLVRLKNMFGPRLALRLQKVGSAQEADCNNWCARQCAELGIPPVAANPVRRLDRKGFELSNIRKAIQDKTTLLQMNVHGLTDGTPLEYLETAEKYGNLFDEVPAAVDNANEIARRCNVEIEFGNYQLPTFPVPTGMDEEGFLTSEARNGLAGRLKEIFEDSPEALERERETYEKRLEYELGVIKSMGFPGYFLIVADFINWAKNNGVAVGPGRGSGAGSLVAYSLGITDINPLEHGLMFERFLNPERVSMPDFDVDFAVDGRDRVIEYVRQKYGKESVSQIVTFGTLSAKAALKSVARVQGIPFKVANAISSLVPNTPGITLAQVEEQNNVIKLLSTIAMQSGDNPSEVLDIWEKAKAIEGLVASRNGRHAGGVDIVGGPLDNLVPVRKSALTDGSEFRVTQYDKDDSEEVGLVKFDFLGLRNLNVIQWALDDINAKRTARGQVPLIKRRIPMNDEKALGLLQAGDTTSVFQLESRGMKELLKKLRPEEFKDVVALVALYRPGPLESGMVDDFINRRHGLEPIKYLHPDLESILEPTYGIILYQEQVMEIAQKVAGYTRGQADLLRRAMGKKKQEVMDQQKKAFIEGAVEHGWDSYRAEEVFDLMAKFAKYGFNKSHSVCYAHIAMETAWIKAHYPAEFMAAVLSSEGGRTDKITIAIDEAKRMGIPVDPPSVNRSERQFVASDDGRIRYGMGAIKGVGDKIMARILSERRHGGPFVSLYDLCLRCNPNKREVEALVSAGALDELGQNRATLWEAVADVQKAARAATKRGEAADLFGGSDLAGDPGLEVMPPWTRQRVLDEEKRVLGVFLTGHPVQEYAEEIEHVGGVSTIGPLVQAAEEEVADSAASGVARFSPRAVKLCGYVTDAVTFETKRKERYTKLDVDDGTGILQVVVSAQLHSEKNHLMRAGSILMLEGTMRRRAQNGRYYVVCNEVSTLGEVRERHARSIRIAAPAADIGEIGNRLGAAIGGEVKGPCRIVIGVGDQQTESGFGVFPTDGVMRALREEFGDANIKTIYAGQSAMDDDKTSSQTADDRRRQGAATRGARWSKTEALLDEARQAMDM